MTSSYCRRTPRAARPTTSPASASSASTGRSATASACSNIRPATRLSEEELAEEFKISRTPVRRVLARLESEGLIEARHGVGTIVTDIEIEELAQVYHLRLELAVLIGRLSPIPRSTADLDRIRALIARFDALPESPTTRPSPASTWIFSPRSAR